MSSPDWQELERLWQSSSSSEVAQAKNVVARMHRRPWLLPFTAAAEVLMFLVGIASSIWVLLNQRSHSVLIAVILFIFTLCAGGFSLWARLAPKPAAEASVTAAIDLAIHRLRVRVRLALGTLWMNGIFMFLIALMALIWAQPDAYTTRQVHGRLFAIIAWCAYGGLIQVVTIPYYLRRARELQQLEQIKHEL